VQFVVVFNLTRFAREKYDHFALRAHRKSLGISLRSATEPIDDTSTGKLMEVVLAAGGENEESDTRQFNIQAETRMDARFDSCLVRNGVRLKSIIYGEGSSADRTAQPSPSQ
jgi:hypothetical protein